MRGSPKLMNDSRLPHRDCVPTSVASFGEEPNASHRKLLRTRNPRVENAETDRPRKNGARFDDCAPSP